MTAAPRRGTRGGPPARARRAAKLVAALALPNPGDTSPLGWTEAQLQREITGYVDDLDARLQQQYPGVPGMRMLWHHETDSRKTRPGWLDLTIAGPGGTIHPELKTEEHRTRVSPEQRLWLEVLTYNGSAAFLWTPADWVAGAIQNELQRLARPRRAVPPVRELAPATKKCGCLAGQPHTCVTWGGLL